MKAAIAFSLNLLMLCSASAGPVTDIVANCSSGDWGTLIHSSKNSWLTPAPLRPAAGELEYSYPVCVEQEGDYNVSTLISYPKGNTTIEVVWDDTTIGMMRTPLLPYLQDMYAVPATASRLHLSQGSHVLTFIMKEWSFHADVYMLAPWIVSSNPPLSTTQPLQKQNNVTRQTPSPALRIQH